MSKALESFESLIDLIDFLTEEIPLSSQNVDWFYNIGDDIKNVKNELEKCAEFENKLKAILNKAWNGYNAVDLMQEIMELLDE